MVVELAIIVGGDESGVPVDRLVAIVENDEKRLHAHVAKEKTRQSRKSILIVDEKYLTETLRIIFQIIGYHVDTAHNGIQALRKTLDRPYDLVIMETNLSDAGGFEMAQIIKNMSKKTKMVLMTGDEHWEKTLSGAPIEIDDILLKPFAPEELVNVVRRILGPWKETKDGKTPRLPFA